MAHKKQRTNAELAFDQYESTLEWIDRWRQETALRFYNDQKDYWRHAKEVAFSLYQGIRPLLGELPALNDLLDRSRAGEFPPYRFEGGDAGFPCVGVLKYRDGEYPVYDDEYGMNRFVVVDGHSVQVESSYGETDWYFELDKIIDRIYDYD